MLRMTKTELPPHLSCQPALCSFLPSCVLSCPCKWVPAYPGGLSCNPSAFSRDRIAWERFHSQRMPPRASTQTNKEQWFANNHINCWNHILEEWRNLLHFRNRASLRTQSSTRSPHPDKITSHSPPKNNNKHIHQITSVENPRWWQLNGVSGLNIIGQIIPIAWEESMKSASLWNAVLTSFLKVKKGGSLVHLHWQNVLDYVVATTKKAQFLVKVLQTSLRVER